jgi:hypothetical protein
METKTLKIDDVMLKERTEEGADSPQRHREHRDGLRSGATAAWERGFRGGMGKR